MAYEEAIKEEVLKAKTEDINELENIKTSIQQTSDVDEKEVKKLNDEVLAKVVDISDQILTNSISNPDEVAIAEEIKAGLSASRVGGSLTPAWAAWAGYVPDRITSIQFLACQIFL